MFIIVLGQHVSILIQSSSGPSMKIDLHLKCLKIMFIIVLGQHVSILIESSSGPSMKIDLYLKCLKMRCGIPNAYILDKTIYKMHMSLL